MNLKCHCVLRLEASNLADAIAEAKVKVPAFLAGAEDGRQVDVEIEGSPSSSGGHDFSARVRVTNQAVIDDFG